jgi:hypothetical protein
MDDDILKENMSEIEGGSMNGSDMEEMRKRSEEIMKVQMELRDKNDAILS